MLLIPYYNWIKSRLSMNEMYNGKPISYEINNDGLLIESDLGKSMIEWNNFMASHQGKEWLFLEYKGNGFLSIPLKSIKIEIVDLLKNKIIQSHNPSLNIKIN